MRLATFNLLHGRSLTDGLVEADRIHRAVESLDVDVLGLQEVDRDQPRSGGLDLTALVADAVGATAYRFAAAVVGTPGEEFVAAGRGRPAPDTAARDRPAPDPAARDRPAAGHPERELTDDPDDGRPQYGVALVSRYPVRRWFVHRLPAAPARSPVPVGGRVLLLPDEPRVVLAAVLDTPTGPLTVATTHLSFVPGWNVRQLRRSARALAALPGPRVLLGDLNLPPSVARLASGWRVAARLPTYPAPNPRIQLDHILLDRAFTAEPVGVFAPPTPISDHRPLIAAFAP